jgi:ATP-dependent helicase/nuclease subunit A
MLAREIDLTDDQRAELLRQALGVLNDPTFAALFGPGSTAEVALVGSLAGPLGPVPVSGRVDRLLVEADRVLVADFKTNRTVPAELSAADPAYILQMAVYGAILEDVYPGRRIEAALVWTDTPSLMPIPSEMMRAALARHFA